MNENIVELCKRTPIAQVLADRGIDIKTHSRGSIACCPLHGEKTPSFNFKTNSNGVEWFFCFGCLKGGDVINLLALLENKKNGDIIYALSKKHGLKINMSDLKTSSPTGEEVLRMFCDLEDHAERNLIQYVMSFLERHPTDDAVDKVSIMYERMDKLLETGDEKGIRDMIGDLLRIIDQYEIEEDQVATVKRS